ncbi:MAG: hypothetical protein LBD41_04065 [Clostridiales Family XIII bacterium]|jgi:hypothetical protein|nr:hypothetical protein [Clostridiales Family XIII bacterium]
MINGSRNSFLYTFLIFLVPIILLLFFTSVVKAKSVAPNIEWQKSFGGNNNEQSMSIQNTSDGGYIIAGFSDSNDTNVTENHGSLDFWIVKINSRGNMQWQKSLGGSNDDTARTVLQTVDGGYLVAGASKSNDGDVKGNHGKNDCWIVKLDTQGNIQWQKSLGGSDDDTVVFSQLTLDGGYIILGTSSSKNGDVTGNHGKADVWLVKLDSTGTIQWQKSLGGRQDELARSLQITPDGGYIISADSQSKNGDLTENHGKNDFWIVKLDSQGNIQWQKSLGGSDKDYANFIQITSDGGYIIAGASSSKDGQVTGNHGNVDYWIVKLDSQGNIQWQKSVGGSQNEYANSLLITRDGGYIIVGLSDSNDGDVAGNHGKFDQWIVKLDSQGTIQWQKCLGGDELDVALSAQTTSDGGTIIAGSTISTNGDVSKNYGSFDFWIVKLKRQ